MQANLAAMRAANTLNWINENPEVVNINSVEVLSIGMDVLMNPSTEGKIGAQAIWELRKANAEVFCQASPDSAYVGLIESVIYGEEIPKGLAENRAYVERVFGVNVYARIAKAEGRDVAYNNPQELMEMLQQREIAATTLDPKILEYTDILLQELYNVLTYKTEFANVPVSSREK